MARDMFRKVRYEFAKSRAADRPAVYEQRIGTAPDATVGHFTNTDVEKVHWWITKEL